LGGMTVLYRITLVLMGLAPLTVWASGDPRAVAIGLPLVLLAHTAAIAGAILWPIKQRTWWWKAIAPIVGLLASIGWWFGVWKLPFDEPYNNPLASTIWLFVPFVLLLIAGGVVRFRRVTPSS